MTAAENPRAVSGNNRLKEFVDRIENLEAQKKEFVDDIRDVYAEAKGTGLNPKALRKVVADRKKDAKEREAFETDVELYMHQLGML